MKIVDAGNWDSIEMRKRGKGKNMSQGHLCFFFPVNDHIVQLLWYVHKLLMQKELDTGTELVLR